MGVGRPALWTNTQFTAAFRTLYMQNLAVEKRIFSVDEREVIAVAVGLEWWLRAG